MLAALSCLEDSGTCNKESCSWGDTFAALKSDAFPLISMVIELVTSAFFPCIAMVCMLALV